jgi:hypothetical protein
VHQFSGNLVVTKRLGLALAAYVGLAALAFTTLTDPKIRAATLVILAMFAAKTWIRRGDAMHPGRDVET